MTFGPFELDLQNGLLYRSGVLVHLRPQPLAALRLLVGNAGSIVSREDLQRAIWRPDEHVDFKAGVNFAIAQLRAALDDPAARSQFIHAVPRRGYRFVAVVVATPTPSTEEVPAVETPLLSAAIPEEAPAAPSPSARWLRIAAVVALALAASSRVMHVAQPRSEQPAALKALSRGSTGLADAGPTELSARLKAFDTAIEADPRLGAAYAGKSSALLLAGNYRVEPPAAAYANALAFGERAVALAPNLAEAHAAYGAALLYAQWEWTRARREFEVAIALDAGSANAHRLYARFLSASGEHERAISEATRAVSLAPSSAAAITELGSAFFYAGDFAAAIRTCDEASQLLPAFVPARRCATAAAAEVGDYRAAASRVSTSLTDPLNWATSAGFWSERLKRIQSSVAASSCNCDEPLLAVPMAHLDDRDAALAILERGADRASDHLLFAGVHPAFKAMRATTRFHYVLRRLGLSSGAF